MIKKILFLFLLFQLFIFFSFAYTITTVDIYHNKIVYKDVITYHLDEYYLKMQLKEDCKKIIINRFHILSLEIEN